MWASSILLNVNSAEKITPILPFSLWVYMKKSLGFKSHIYHLIVIRVSDTDVFVQALFSELHIQQPQTLRSQLKYVSFNA